MKKTVVLFLFCSVTIGLFSQKTSGIYKNGWIDFNKNGVKDIYEDPAVQLEERVADLLLQMTVEEKTCQLATLYGSGRVLKDSLPAAGWENEIWKDGIANMDEQANGLGNFGSSISYPYTRSIENRRAIQRWFVEETRLGIPVDYTNEGIRGLCHDRATMFPAQCGQGATWNRKLIREVAEVTAKEAVALGYTNIYSPILDVSRDPRWGRVVECYSEDPYLAGELGRQMITGLQSHKLVSTPKHFAVYSIPVGGRDEATRTDPHVAPREMKTLLLEPFRKGIQEADAWGVMSSYNDYDGSPISGNYHFLTEILRQQWGFKGYVVSDSEAVEFIHTKHKTQETLEDVAAQVVNAGLNVRTHFTPPGDFILPVRKAVEQGKISMETLDKRVAEVLRVKFMLGLFDNPYKGDLKNVATIVHSEEHKSVSLRTALESVVLLKNENNRLPLSKKWKKIAVIGPNADEQKEMICRYGPANVLVKTVFGGIKEYLPEAEVKYAKGCNIIDNYYPESELYEVPLDSEERRMIDEAVELADNSDIAILVLGGNEQTVREEYSRSDLKLMGRQEQLLKAVYQTGKPVVLVLLDGRASAINWADKYIPAIVHAWFPGEFTGNAVSQVLFGDYNPGGKLAVTFPKSVGQIPYAFPFKPGAESEGKVRVSGALYPFGYGLSYTTFEYSGLKIENSRIGIQGNVQLSCVVKNTGSRAGDEVVQLYIRDDYSSVTTYEKNLRGFERVKLRAGESKEVKFTLTPRELGLWNKHDEFVVEPGTFTVMIGSSSEDIKLTGAFECVADTSFSENIDVSLDSLSFVVESSDEDWVFASPQQIDFNLKLKNTIRKDFSFNIICKISTDDYITVDSAQFKVMSDKNGNINQNITFLPPSPGFYRFEVCAEKNGVKGKSLKFNMGYEPEKILVSTDSKEDFSEFWKETRRELEKIAPQYRMTLLKEQSTEIKNIYHVEMYSFGNIKIEGYYSVPKKAGKYPAIIAYMGYGAKPYFPDANSLPDFCEFVLSTRGQGIQKEQNTYGDWLVYGLENKENYYYRGAYMDLIRGIDFLCSRPEINPDKIVAEGGSQGGAFTLIACALDKRIKGGAPHIPFLTDFPNYFKICPWPRSAFENYIQKNPDENWETIYDLLSYFDVKNFAPQILCPIIMGVGLQDHVCPPRTNFTSYNLINTEKSYFIYHDQQHAIGKSWWKTRENFFRKTVETNDQ
jgi:beta-glucosidase